MRKASKRKRQTDDEEEPPERAPRPWWWRLLLRRPRDTFAAAVAMVAASAIVVNASYLQHGPHPAPIFAVKPLPIAAGDARDVVGVVPHTHPVEHEPVRHDTADAGTAAAPIPPAAQNIAKLHPPVAASHKDPIAELLVGHAATAQPTPPAPIPAPTRSLVAPSRQVLAVQRALSEYGYGQIKPTGIVDADTRIAIEHFERDHKLPVTGEITDRVTHELAALTGHEIN